MELAQFPIEILFQIFHLLSMYDIQKISRVNKRFRNTISEKIFAVDYLRREAKSMLANITILESIFSLDKIAIGKSADSTVVVIQSPDVTKVYKLKLSLSGRLSTEYYQCLEQCQLLNETNHADCALCLKFGIVEYNEIIDKMYRVFFQTWQDSFNVKNSVGATFVINIRHDAFANRNDWVETKKEPFLEISRYGLKVLDEDITFVETMWPFCFVNDSIK